MISLPLVITLGKNPINFFEPKKNSRLSCQLIVSYELDGLEVNIPSKQG